MASSENLTSLVGDDGEPLDAEAAAEALERREAEIANRRKIRAEKLMDQKAKAREMSEARRAERVAAHAARAHRHQRRAARARPGRRVRVPSRRAQPTAAEPASQLGRRS